MLHGSPSAYLHFHCHQMMTQTWNQAGGHPKGTMFKPPRS